MALRRRRDYLESFGKIDKEEISATLNEEKSDVRPLASPQQVTHCHNTWRLGCLGKPASLTPAYDSCATFGAEVNGVTNLGHQLTLKVRDAAEMPRRVQSCQGPQIKRSLTRT